MIIVAVVTRWLYSTKPRSMYNFVASNHELRWLLSLSPVVCGQPGQCTNTPCTCATISCGAFAKQLILQLHIGCMWWCLAAAATTSYKRERKVLQSSVALQSVPSSACGLRPSVFQLCSHCSPLCFALVSCEHCGLWSPDTSCGGSAHLCSFYSLFILLIFRIYI